MTVQSYVCSLQLLTVYQALYIQGLKRAQPDKGHRWAKLFSYWRKSGPFQTAQQALLDRTMEENKNSSNSIRVSGALALFASSHLVCPERFVFLLPIF